MISRDRLYIHIEFRIIHTLENEGARDPFNCQHDKPDIPHAFYTKVDREFKRSLVELVTLEILLEEVGTTFSSDRNKTLGPISVEELVTEHVRPIILSIFISVRPIKVASVFVQFFRRATAG